MQTLNLTPTKIIFEEKHGLYNSITKTLVYMWQAEDQTKSFIVKCVWKTLFACQKGDVHIDQWIKQMCIICPTDQNIKWYKLV